jgi:MFS family permease
VLIGWWLLKEHAVAPKYTTAPQLGFRDLGRAFAVFTAISTLFSLGNSSDAFLILRAQNVGMPVAVIPLAYFGFNALYALLATPAGSLSDRIGRWPLLVLGYTVFALVYAGFAVAGDAFLAGSLFLIYSLYYALTEGVGRALITDLVPTSLRATAMGSYATATGAALLPASVVAGALWDRVGPGAPFGYGAVLAGLAVMLLLMTRSTLVSDEVASRT